MGTAIAEKVKYLNQTLRLTQHDVGQILNSSSRTVARWSSGDASPQRLTKQRLLELVYVGEQLSKVLKPEDANLWIFSPNPLLKGESPAERIAQGDFKTVLALIEALADGIVV